MIRDTRGSQDLLQSLPIGPMFVYCLTPAISVVPGAPTSWYSWIQGKPTHFLSALLLENDELVTSARGESPPAVAHLPFLEDLGSIFALINLLILTACLPFNITFSIVDKKCYISFKGTTW